MESFAQACDLSSNRNPVWLLSRKRPMDGKQCALCEQLKPEVAIVDVAMPQLNGIEAVSLIGKTSPQDTIPHPQHAHR